VQTPDTPDCIVENRAGTIERGIRLKNGIKGKYLKSIKLMIMNSQKKIRRE